MTRFILQTKVWGFLAYTALRKTIYIIKIIIISMAEQLRKKEIEELYKDAIYNRLIREGYSEYHAEYEARRRMMLEK